MKELQAGLQLVRTKCIQRNRHPRVKKKAKALNRVAVESLPQQVSDRQKPPLYLPVKSPVGVLRQRTMEGLRRLKNQGLRINQLSAELEEAMSVDRKLFPERAIANHKGDFHELRCRGSSPNTRAELIHLF